MYRCLHPAWKRSISHHSTASFDIWNYVLCGWLHSHYRSTSLLFSTMTDRGQSKRPRTHSGSSGEGRGRPFIGSNAHTQQYTNRRVAWSCSTEQGVQETDNRRTVDSQSSHQCWQAMPGKSTGPRWSAERDFVPRSGTGGRWSAERDLVPRISSSFRWSSDRETIPRNSRGRSAEPESQSRTGAPRSSVHRVASTSTERRDTGARTHHHTKPPFRRQWLNAVGSPSGTVSPSGGFNFSIMTYNILSQQLLDDNNYLYSSTIPSNLPWDERRQKILSEIKTHSPDILCLQEVQQDHFDDHLKSSLTKLGYYYLYKQRTGSKPDGCALLFKKSKFVLENWSLLEYYQNSKSLMDRDNVAIVAILKAKTANGGNARVCVATTHVLFNMKRGDVKLGQVCMLMAEIGRVMGTNHRCPLILCGDFNCYPFSPLYNFLVFGHLPCENLFCDFIAGQPDYHSRRTRPLEKGVLPPSGIDENCRYIPSQKMDAAGTGSKCSDDSVTPKDNPHQPNLREDSTGNLRHDFQLVSAYRHFTARGKHYLPEVTTHHGQATCTVDYIFYSVASRKSTVRNGHVRPSEVVEGDLKLLERLDLLVPKEANKIGCFPSHQFGSDHLSLMCKFCLKVD